MVVHNAVTREPYDYGAINEIANDGQVNHGFDRCAVGRLDVFDEQPTRGDM